MGNGRASISVQDLGGALGAAVATRREGWVLAEHASTELGRAVAVAVPCPRGWRIDGAARVVLDGNLELPADLPPEVSLSRMGSEWVGRDLRHGGRVVGRLLAAGSDAPAELMAEMAAIAAPFFAARAPLPGADWSAATHIAQIAHDLRRPLTTLSLSLDGFHRGPIGPTLVERSRRAVRRLAGMIDDLQITASPSPFAQVALAPLVAELVDDDTERARLGQVSMVLALNARPLVLGHERALARAIGNMLDNALDVSPRGARVTVTVDAGGDEAWVLVKDQGPGAPPGLRERIFEPFVSTRAGGVGLGLAVTRRVAREHGGTSRFLDGEGGIVELRLPLHR